MPILSDLIDNGLRGVGDREKERERFFALLGGTEQFAEEKCMSTSIHHQSFGIRPQMKQWLIRPNPIFWLESF